MAEVVPRELEEREELNEKTKLSPFGFPQLHLYSLFLRSYAEVLSTNILYIHKFIYAYCYISDTYKYTVFHSLCETPNRYFLNKQPHLANKSCAKCSPYKPCPRKLPFLKRKKIAPSVNFHFHLKSHSEVNYNNNILICIKQL